MKTETKISVLILTYNEEINLTGCVNSCKDISDDIWVLDSHSEDNTQKLTKNLKVNLELRVFDNYANQRNHGLNNIDFKHEWILMIDADERIDTVLKTEIINMDFRSLDSVGMLLCRRKDHFLGGWLKRSSGYPTWFPKFFKKGHCSTIREINEEYRTDLEVRKLNGHIDHFPFNKGVSEWFIKHVRYARMEAKLLYNENPILSFSSLFLGTALEKRKAQKALVYRLPFRPLIVFFIFYIIRLGFMDGKAGFYYCLMKLEYEIMISCNLMDLKEKGKNNRE